jgi:Glycosyl hydrolase family 71
MGWASNYVVPTTTLAAQTANNTSAANGFVNQSNGNRGANNVSKVDVHSLLYPGATTKVFAHLMLWFGQQGHISVGYNSNDAAQVQRQIADMISRGIDGVIIDWYGPNNSIDRATQAVMNEAEKHPGFSFAIMIDAGAIGQSGCSGCSPQQSLIKLLQYVEQKYFVSKAYFTIGGQPVVTNFNVDGVGSIDWNTVNGAISIHPRFLFQDNGGFKQAMSDGSYSWVMPRDSNYGLDYLSSFYHAGLASSHIETVGAAYKGFNDSLAAWGSRRVMSQQCGKTWLQTFSKINSLYNSGRQLPYLQLVTWNDYDEATELESGIDACFSLTASVSGSALQWGISGNENTVDHYNVYISADGQNLMTLTNTQPGLHSVDLCSFPIPSGNYKLFVQAVGKPMLANRMPGPVSYSPACANTGTGTPTSQNASFTASPTTLTIPSGKSGQVTVTAQPAASNKASIALSCNYLPANLVCSFSPTTITPGNGTATSTLKITNTATAAKNSSSRSSGFMYASWIFSFGFAGFVFAGNLKNTRRVLSIVLACAAVGGVMLTSSCGGGKSLGAASTNGPSTYTISVLGNSDSTQISTEVVVSVQ